MTKEIKETKAMPQASKYGKAAFLDAAKDPKERIILQVVLEDEKQYTREEASDLATEWKNKEVKA